MIGPAPVRQSPAASRPCPACGRRLRDHAEALALDYMRRNAHLGVLAVRDVADGAGLPVRLAARVMRRPSGPFERVVRDPSSPGRPWLYRPRGGVRW